MWKISFSCRLTNIINKRQNVSRKNKYDISFDDLNICTQLGFLTWTRVFSTRRYAVTCLFIQSQVPVRVQIVSTLCFYVPCFHPKKRPRISPSASLTNIPFPLRPHSIHGTPWRTDGHSLIYIFWSFWINELIDPLKDRGVSSVAFTAAGHKQAQWNRMSHDMTKPTKWVCAQRWLRSAWASAQSDQSLRCALNG